MWEAIRGALTQVSRDGTKPKVCVFSTPPLTKAGWYAALFGAKASGWTRVHVSGFDSPRVSREWIAPGSPSGSSLSGEGARPSGAF